MKSTIEINREFQERKWRQQKVGDRIFRVLAFLTIVGIGVVAFRLGEMAGG